MRHLILASVALLVSADVLLSETEPDFGFERANPNASPKHWRANAGAGHPLEVAKCITEEPPFVRSGKSAVKLVQTGKRKDGRPLIGHLYSIFTVPVKASAGYVIRFYARGNGQIGAAVYCYTLKDGQSAFSHTLNARADDVGARGGMIAVREENRWKLCSFRFTSPPMEKEVHEIRVVIRIRGTVYVDDSELSTEQSTQATPEEMKPVEGSFRTNLVSVICKASVPRIDGQIEEAEYSTRWTGLIENSSNSLYPQRGEFFLSGDLSRFYFGMAVQMPANYRLRARGKGRDDPALICDTDVFYFFFRRDAETEAKGFQGVYLAVSSKGVIYDAWEDIHWKEARCRRDASFNAEWKVKTNLKDDLWALELSVPWNDLGVTPRKAAQTFAIAFGLNLQGTQLTWQAFSNWYDHYQGFGRLQVATDGLASQVSGLGTIRRGTLAPEFSLHSGSDREKEFSLAVVLSTPRKVAGKIAGYVFDVELDPSRERITSKEVIHQWRENGTLTPNTVKKLSNTTKLQKPGHYVIELEARMGGRPWLYQKLPCRYLPPLEASLRPIPSRSVIGTRLRLHGADPDERGKVRIDFQDDEGTVALSHEAAVDGNELQLELPMKDLRPGDYKASFELWDTKGRKIWTATQPFRKWDTPEWLKNRKALEALESDWVPAPWRPVRTTGGQVSLWGRRISFGRGTFISQIESQSVPLLSDAAQIHYSAKGKEHRIKISESVIQMKGQGRAIATQQGNSPNFALSVKHTIEFDGMHRIDLSLRPKQRGKIESLWIDLPFRESKYLFFSSQKGLRSSAWQAGLFPERGRSEPDFYKWIWLGNDRVGCCLFVENYKGWLVNSTKPRISLESHGKTKRLRLLLVNEPSEILKPVQITFGLMATPVKPFFKGWRSMRAQGLNIGERPGNLSLASPDYWNAHYSRPSPRNWRALNDMVNYAHGRGQRVYPYIGLLYISPFEYIRKDFGFSDFSNGGFPEGVAVNRTAEAARLEEYFYYKADWDLSPPSVSMPARETRAEARLTPASSYSDYFVHGVYEMLTKSDIDGYFFDIDNPMLDRNTTKGHLYRTKDGNEEGTYELFAIRDLYKRIYYLFEKYRGPERKPYILGHGFAMSAPYMSFWDAAVNGEEIKPKKRFEFTRTFLQKRLYGSPAGRLEKEESSRSYDAFSYRCAHGPQSGLPAIFLPQYGYIPELKTREHAREILSFTFLHNDTIWLAYIPAQPILDFWQSVERPFGMGDTEFFPYWRNGVQSSPKCIRVSFWKKTRARDWLVAVANWSGRQTAATIQLPAPLKTLEVCMDMETGRQVPPGRKWSVTIPAHDLRVFRFSD